MAIRGEKNTHYHLRDIQARHWQRLAARCGPGVWVQMKSMVDSVDGVLDAVASELPTGFPLRTWEPISTGMRRHAQLFQRSLASVVEI
jgi:serine/threonine-protein kinase HipA